MMKKLASILLAILMVALLSSAAMAEAKVMVGSDSYGTLEAAIEKNGSAEYEIYGQISVSSFAGADTSTFVGKTADAEIVVNPNQYASYGGVGSVKFKDLTFTTNDYNYKGFHHSTQEEFENCTINGTYWTYAPNAYFTGCTFNQDTAGVYCLWNYGTSNLVVENCTFNSAARTVLLYNEGAVSHMEGTFKNCKFVANEYYKDAKKAAIEMDDKFHTIALTVENNLVDCKIVDGLSKDKNNNGTEIPVTASGNGKWHSTGLQMMAGEEATCVSNGKHEYWSCSVCKKNYSDADGKTEIVDFVVIPADPAYHNMTHYSGKDATCVSDGKHEYWSCSVCKKNYSDADGKTEIVDIVIPANPAYHNMTYHSGKDATYAADGEKAYYACGSCQKIFWDELGKNEITNKNELVIPKLVAVENGEAEVELDAVKDAIENASSSAIVTIPVIEAGSKENVETVTLPAEAVKEVQSAGKGLELVTNEEVNSENKKVVTSITVDNKALETMLADVPESKIEDAKIKISVKLVDDSVLNSKQVSAMEKAGKTAVVINATMTVNNKLIHDFKGGSVDIKLPFELKAGMNPKDLKLIYVDDQGNTEMISDARFENGYIYATLKHFSSFVVVDTSEAVIDQAVVENLPQTGDNSMLLLWVGLLMISLCAYTASKKVRA